jgi:hypothetical protein
MAREVEEALRGAEQERLGDAEFVRLRDFLREMQSRGMIVRKEYDLPPLDTIGKTAFHSKLP